MVLTCKDVEPYKENVPKLRDMLLEEVTKYEELYQHMDIKRIKDAKDDDITVCRVLMSKKNDLKTSFQFVKKSLKWRKENGAENFKQSDFSPEILNYKPLQIYHADKEGNIMIVFNLKGHIRNFIPKETLRRYMIHWVDILFELDHYQQATLVANLDGAGLKNIDIDFVLTFLDVVKNHYPQAIAHILVVGMHWIFEAAYTIVKPFIPTELAERLRFVKKGKELEEYLDMNVVGPELGGNAIFEPPPVFINYKTYVEERLKFANGKPDK